MNRNETENDQIYAWVIIYKAESEDCATALSKVAVAPHLIQIPQVAVWKIIFWTIIKTCYDVEYVYDISILFMHIAWQ